MPSLLSLHLLHMFVLLSIRITLNWFFRIWVMNLVNLRESFELQGPRCKSRHLWLTRHDIQVHFKGRVWGEYGRVRTQWNLTPQIQWHWYYWHVIYCMCTFTESDRLSNLTSLWPSSFCIDMSIRVYLFQVSVFSVRQVLTLWKESLEWSC